VQFPLIVAPDEQMRRQALARHAELAKPVGSLGRLEELGAWLAACQGSCPPRPLARPRVVVFAADHGIASRGVSAQPPGATANAVDSVVTGTAAVNVLATVAGAGVRVVDVAVDADTPEPVGKHKIRRSSGLIDVEDALPAEEAPAAVQAGRDIADEEVDAGTDLLLAGAVGVGQTTPAAVIVAAVTGAEPVAVVGRGSGIDDGAWMRKAAVIRDARRRGRPVVGDPIALVRTAGGADLAALAGFLAQAAVRRTPVVLDGLAVGAAAMLADKLAPGARQWWLAGHRCAEPAHAMVLAHLQLKPLLDLDLRLGDCSGAVAALPLLQMAAQLLVGMPA
jgi:nicotinate-nucleotide--dimethylbenzimidazole phosphoribosyltransferase